jgi:hypothetical protein
MEPYIDKEERQRIKRKAIAAHKELLLDKKEQILAILREITAAEARHIIGEIKRKMDNDEIDAKYFVKE